MLKDLINQEQQTPEKCSGCGSQIRDRWGLTWNCNFSFNATNLQCIQSHPKQLLPPHGWPSLARELPSLLSLFTKLGHRAQLLFARWINLLQRGLLQVRKLGKCSDAKKSEKRKERRKKLHFCTQLKLALLIPCFTNCIGKMQHKNSLLMPVSLAPAGEMRNVKCIEKKWKILQKKKKLKNSLETAERERLSTRAISTISRWGKFSSASCVIALNGTNSLFFHTIYTTFRVRLKMAKNKIKLYVNTLRLRNQFLKSSMQKVSLEVNFFTSASLE